MAAPTREVVGGPFDGLRARAGGGAFAYIEPQRPYNACDERPPLRIFANPAPGRVLYRRHGERWWHVPDVLCECGSYVSPEPAGEGFGDCPLCGADLRAGNA